MARNPPRDKYALHDDDDEERGVRRGGEQQLSEEKGAAAAAVVGGRHFSGGGGGRGMKRRNPSFKNAAGDFLREYKALIFSPSFFFAAIRELAGGEGVFRARAILMTNRSGKKNVGSMEENSFPPSIVVVSKKFLHAEVKAAEGGNKRTLGECREGPNGDDGRRWRTCSRRRRDR